LYHLFLTDGRIQTKDIREQSTDEPIASSEYVSYIIRCYMLVLSLFSEGI